jgi:pimeloyl-ACP methyl ester carboxylesterase
LSHYSKVIELDHIKIAAEIHGDANKPQLLCLHGWQDNLNSFHRLLPFLTNYYCVVLIDWPGHGASQHRSSDSHYHFIDQVDDLVGVLELEWLNPVAVIGHSMGAAVLSLVCASFPELVRKAIFIDMLGPLSIDESETHLQMRKSVLRYKNLDRFQSKVFQSIDAAVRRRQQAAPMPYDDVLPIVERNLQRVENGFSWRTDPRLKIPSKFRMTESQVQVLLKQIASPVLLIASSESLNGLRMNMHARLKAIDDFQLEVIDGGHHIHIEQPEKVSNLINHFLLSD